MPLHTAKHIIRTSYSLQMNTAYRILHFVNSIAQKLIVVERIIADCVFTEGTVEIIKSYGKRCRINMGVEIDNIFCHPQTL